MGTTYVNATGTDTVGAVIVRAVGKRKLLGPVSTRRRCRTAGSKGNAHSIGLAERYNLSFELTAAHSVQREQLETEEMSWAQGWMNLNLTGLPAQQVYVMPGTYADPVTENIAASLGYEGVRGTGSLKPVLWREYYAGFRL